jgi:hypothetical protein
LNQTANNIVLSRTAASLVPAETITLQFSGVINPSVLGSFYGRIQTFPTMDASGLPTDVGGDAMAITNSISVTTYVPPYLLFCTAVTIPNLNCNDANGNYIDFGNLSPFSTGSSESQMVVATNALNGYGIQVIGNSMTSGNNVISPLGVSDLATPGANQFGLNLVANTSPQVGNNAQGPGSGQPLPSYGLPNIFRFNSGDTLASSNTVSANKEYTISYIINIAHSQPPGYYATTLTYVALGNF